MIHQQHSASVFGLIHDLIDELAPAASYRNLFDIALASVRQDAEESEVFIPIDLPLAVADLLGRSGMEGMVGAAASTLLWSGADLMDDAADGELTDRWSGVSPNRIALVSTNLLSTLPHLLIGELDAGDGAISSAYSQAVARTLFAMSEGQSADLDSPQAVQTVDDYLALVRRKTGAEFALFASTPAMLADADGDTVAAWVRFGFAYGAMIQVFSDTVSIVAEGQRNDLFRGKRTLPVLLALTSTRGAEHISLLEELDMAAAGDEAAVARVIETMTRCGAIRSSLERGELLRYRASEALPVLLTDLPATHPMRTLIRSYSVI